MLAKKPVASADAILLKPEEEEEEEEVETGGTALGPASLVLRD
jgi:hypothetical protein